MRRLLLSVLLVLFCAVSSNARNVVTFFSPESCDVCTNASTGRSFSWHMEDDTITTGTPCGCVNSGGDATATRTSATLETTQKSDGSKSLYVAGANYYATFGSNSDVFNSAEGTVTFDVYITTFVNGGFFFVEENDPNNRVIVYMSGADDTHIDFALVYKIGGTSNYCTANSDKGENQWYQVTAKWKTSAATNDMYIQVCDLVPSTRATSNCVEKYENKLSSAWSDVDTRYVGNYNAGDAPAYYIDNLHITKGDSGL